MAATARPATQPQTFHLDSASDPRRRMTGGVAAGPEQTPDRYQVRIGHRTFQGSDIRSLLKLAVAARRASGPDCS